MTVEPANGPLDIWHFNLGGFQMEAERFETVADVFRKRRFSRRRALTQSGAGLAAAGLAAVGVATAQAQDATPAASVGASDLPAAARAIMEEARYTPSHWGLAVADVETGESIYELRGDEWFLAASTTKLFSGAAALNAYGADYRFKTPIHQRGAVSAAGELDGDLILVATGDPTMGGRDTADGRIAFTPFDHINSTAFPVLVTLPPQDPLAGLDDLAQQVAAHGIKRVNGDVIIDDRLFPAYPKDGYILTPIWINDNLIDLTVTPGAAGDDANLEWRPQTSFYQVRNEVKTVTAGEAYDVTATLTAPGVITVTGQIAADQEHAVSTYQVENPAAFARALLIEALARQGVTVTATPAGDNPADRLPARGAYADSDRVALHASLPFSENIRLVEKVSHNQHADMLVFLLALKAGKTTYEAGMLELPAILDLAGIERSSMSLSTGRGDDYTNLFSPKTVVKLLRYMAARPDADVFYDALPVLGVDGTEATTVAADSPVAGKAVAKSGMTVAFDVMNQRALMLTRALAGYLTGKSGRKYAFASFLNNQPVGALDDILTVIQAQGSIIEALYLDL
jgi:D-alanyl-D-alanine carboxypeptidase/D-alanyl-D-alanine-endopeptidase (penicillin-binding protein 4)